jgi:hypothetical protein
VAGYDSPAPGQARFGAIWTWHRLRGTERTHIFLDPQRGIPTTIGGTRLPLNGPVPDNDPFFSGKNYDLNFELDPFPLFEDN